MNVIASASSRNCSSTCRRRAPTALRSPISRVRSVTDTSMMFITPTPPIISVSVPMKTSTALSPLAIPLSAPVVSIESFTRSARIVPRFEPVPDRQDLPHLAHGGLVRPTR